MRQWVSLASSTGQWQRCAPKVEVYTIGLPPIRENQGVSRLPKVSDRAQVSRRDMLPKRKLRKGDREAKARFWLSDP
jgi:hypothetical protein